VADGQQKPPRKVTFPIRPHWFSVGLFTAGILRRIRTGQDEEMQICFRYLLNFCHKKHEKENCI